MISFGISAPGKVILFGEHAVVYGKTAVAASLDRRTHLEFRELPPEESTIELEMPKLRLSKKIPVGQLRDCFGDSTFPKLSVDGHESFYQRIKQLADKIDCEETRQKVSLECFYYAILQVAQEEGLELKACKLRLDSELSIGAGAGSSASFSVCLVATFLRWLHLQKDPEAPPKFSSEDLKKISQYAYNCEKIMHGKPSGIDNSICTFGSIIEFRKGELPNFIPMGSRSLRILLVDTQVGRNTKLLVEKVAGLVKKYPQVFHPVLDAFDSLSLKVVEIVKQLQNLSDADENALNEIYNELSVSCIMINKLLILKLLEI